MTRSSPPGARRIGIATVIALATAACGGGTPDVAPRAPVPRDDGSVRTTGRDRPALAVVVRQGDGQGAVAAAVSTEGVAPDRGALVGVALASLVEARIQAKGIPGATAVGGWGGFRVRTLVASPAEAARVVEGVRDAMLAPVVEGEPALEAVARKVGALVRRPLPDRALVDVAQCTGEAFGTGSDEPPGVAELEGWRRAALGVGRVAFATAGSEAIADAAASALARGPAWPPATAVASPSAAGGGDASPVVYDASGEIGPGAARVVVTARTPTPEQAVAAASSLGADRGPLASRLAALDAPARVRSVVATAHVDGGCVATTLDLEARDLGAAGVSRIATAAALARQEIAVELASTTASPDLGRTLATRASDPRQAAERAAWWTLAGRRPGGPGDLRTALVVGVAATRDAASPLGATAGSLLRDEIDRATIAWQTPAVEARSRVEHGQGEMWVLVASPCGTSAESAADAGSGAVVATAAASMGAANAGDARVEPFVAADGIGVLAHGPAHSGESPLAHARRLADLAARPFAADPLEADALVRARTALLARTGELDARMLGALGAALAPGHPSWVEPLGTSFGLASASDEAIRMRASSIRTGPLRVAVVANADEAQAEAAVRAVDRWVARRPGEARACSPMTSLPTPRPGTYSVLLPAGAPSEVMLASPLAPADDAARAAAQWTAAALDGAGGLLAQALGAAGGSAPGGPLARSWSAAVVGAPRSPALALRISADDAKLDGAVAQTRALLDRLRQGGLREEDRSRAAAVLARATVVGSLDIRARTIELWRGATAPTPPSPDALRAFTATSLHDDALVILGARPARPEAHPFPAHDPRARSRAEVPSR